MVVGPGVISNSRTFGRSFGVPQMFFFSGIESSAGFPNITPRTIFAGNFIHVGRLKVEISELTCCCRVVNGLFTT